MSEIKIIGGKWRGRKIYIKNKSDSSLRPTTSRTRTVLFDWLVNQNLFHSQTIAGDFFCGSGILGLEAIARGVVNIDFIDINKFVINRLIENIQRLINKNTYNNQNSRLSDKMNFYVEDVYKYLTQTEKVYDLVFCDPQYFHQDYQKLIELLADKIGKKGYLYLEAGENLAEKKIINKNIWQIFRYKKVSASHLHLLIKK